ncbi:hypothetical protein, partial [Burkholderia gladioli]|uniref:hypothetical protein n=1 Tax=Burkholderia gladioli TaxID=28095 RepID=UPI001ABADEFA
MPRAANTERRGADRRYACLRFDAGFAPDFVSAFDARFEADSVASFASGFADGLTLRPRIGRASASPS